MALMYQRPVVVLVGLFLLSQAPAAPSQSRPLDCDASLYPMVGASGYGARAADPRCEGIYQSPVAATGLEVVSVTLGPLAFDLQRDDHLVVAVPDLGGLDAEAVQVRAVALPLRTYYRMDASLPPGGVMRWPVEAVLRAWDLTASRLGAFGWIEHEDERVLVPVTVAPEGETLAGATETIIIKLRSPVRLERLLWREIAPDASEPDWRPVIERPVRGGEAVAFELPAGSPGVVHLKFRAQRQDSDVWLALDLNVWRPAA